MLLPSPLWQDPARCRKLTKVKPAKASLHGARLFVHLLLIGIGVRSTSLLVCAAVSHLALPRCKQTQP